MSELACRLRSQKIREMPKLLQGFLNVYNIYIDGNFDYFAINS